MDLPRRKRNRLRNYDYSQNGAYFITICTENRIRLFGKISVGADLVSARVKLSNAGQMIDRIFTETISQFPDIISDIYIIMPNHFHCIVTIQRADTRSALSAVSEANISRAALTKLDSFVQAFKSRTTVEYIKGVKSGIYPPFNKRVWQRNYYEHIIRDDFDYQQKWRYIDENPIKWHEDCYYVDE